MRIGEKGIGGGGGSAQTPLVMRGGPDRNLCWGRQLLHFYEVSTHLGTPGVAGECSIGDKHPRSRREDSNLEAGIFKG